MEKKFAIKEAWLLDDKGEKLMKLEGVNFESPLDTQEIIYEGDVAVLKPKKITNKKSDKIGGYNNEQ